MFRTPGPGQLLISFPNHMMMYPLSHGLSCLLSAIGDTAFARVQTLAIHVLARIYSQTLAASSVTHICAHACAMALWRFPMTCTLSLRIAISAYTRCAAEVCAQRCTLRFQTFVTAWRFEPWYLMYGCIVFVDWNWLVNVYLRMNLCGSPMYDS